MTDKFRESGGFGADQMLACLRRISRMMDVRSRFLIAKYGLSLPQTVVLRELSAAAEPLAICDLIRRVYLSQATLTGIVDRLERQEVVRRTRSGRDRRRYLIELTDRGRTMLERIPSPLDERFSEEFESLPAAERDSLLAALRKVVRVMESSTGLAEAAAVEAEKTRPR